MHQETGNSQDTSHPRPAERDSRQAIQTWPDHSDGVVPTPRGIQSFMFPVAPATSGPVCHQIQQQTTTVCVTGSGPPGMGSGCTQPVMGKSGPICLPTSSHLEVGLPVCPTVENPVLVHQETGNSQDTSHPRPAERDSRQAIQTWPDHSDGVVPTPRGIQSFMFPVAPATSGPVCHQIQQQTTTVCVTGSGPPGMGSGCTQPVMGKSGPICLPTSSHLGQSGGEVTGLPLQQNHSDCTRVAQHALVLGSTGNVQSDPLVSAQPAQSGVSTIRPDPGQEPVKPEPTCLAPRATAIKEQGFSEAVAARIEAPQRGSTRSVYEAK